MMSPLSPMAEHDLLGEVEGAAHTETLELCECALAAFTTAGRKQGSRDKKIDPTAQLPLSFSFSQDSFRFSLRAVVFHLIAMSPSISAISPFSCYQQCRHFCLFPIGQIKGPLQECRTIYKVLLVNVGRGRR